jgi:hypothetical protein
MTEVWGQLDGLMQPELLTNVPLTRERPFHNMRSSNPPNGESHGCRSQTHRIANPVLPAPPPRADALVSHRANAFETWLALTDGPGDESIPAYIEQAFRRYLDCGILANGFARAHCDECGHDFLIAF